VAVVEQVAIKKGWMHPLVPTGKTDRVLMLWQVIVVKVELATKVVEAEDF
tara:strand:- start:205 stop:354 length:150 start_codon:yes stop_codon:yes gene_type:complete